VAANVFIAIVDQGSLTAAADHLDMSRSMVTRYLAEIENWAGARLLHRTTRRISLTAAGAQVLISCQKIQALASEVSSTHDVVDSPISGELRISCSLSLGQDVLAPVFQQFLLSYPNVSIDVHVSNSAVNLVKERIDLAIRITNDLDPNLISRKLGSCNSVICAAPKYLKMVGKPENVDQLGEHKCLTYSRFGKSLWAFEYQNKRISIPVSGNFSANDPSIILSSTLQGTGISMQPYYSVASFLATGELVQLLPNYIPQVLEIHGLYSSRRHMSSALRAMIDTLFDAFKIAKL
jgi:DNA-binding transcriptional LysR family regulator